MTSQTGEVKSRQHQLETGIDAEVGKFDIGYRFGYRKFTSDAPETFAYYDPAKHPVHGGAAGEFSSRAVYDDTTMSYNSLPETEKISHKVRFKSDYGKSKISSALGYSKATNKATDLAVKSLNGAVNYTALLNEKSRLVAKAALAKIDADSFYIDLPTYRGGATDLNETDFDYTRYSSLNRTVAKLSAEYITKMNPKMTLSVLAGFDMTNRDDYPVFEDGISTKKIYGQFRINYRKGMYYSTRLKYRFEKISDPFISGKGLFEAVGHGELYPLVPTSNWVFYLQREDLRYQNITTMPTQVHKIVWSSTYSPSSKYNINMGLTGKLDKNTDLDSLDVEHFSFAPNLYLNIMPDEQWMFTTGYTYNYDKSRHPVTITLFDG